MNLVNGILVEFSRGLKSEDQSEDQSEEIAILKKVVDYPIQSYFFGSKISEKSTHLLQIRLFYFFTSFADHVWTSWKQNKSKLLSKS